MKKKWYIRCPYCCKEVPVNITTAGENKAIPEVDHVDVQRDKDALPKGETK